MNRPTRRMTGAKRINESANNENYRNDDFNNENIIEKKCRCGNLAIRLLVKKEVEWFIFLAIKPVW